MRISAQMERAGGIAKEPTAGKQNPNSSMLIISHLIRLTDLYIDNTPVQVVSISGCDGLTITSMTIKMKLAIQKAVTTPMVLTSATAQTSAPTDIIKMTAL